MPSTAEGDAKLESAMLVLGSLSCSALAAETWKWYSGLSGSSSGRKGKLVSSPGTSAKNWKPFAGNRSQMRYLTMGTR
jgi:hypothetical protein